MLLLEFGTHPYDIPALVQLCHFRYNKLLTQRLHDYDRDKKSKVWEFSVNFAFGIDWFDFISHRPLC
jgi:hypothetical protein